MTIRATLLTALALIVAAPAMAENYTYNPYTTGVTHYQLQRQQAAQQRAQLVQPGHKRSRNNYRYVSPEEAKEVLALDRQMKQRFPVHPGLYRDAFDRGSWTRRTGRGGNPGDNWW